MYLDRDDVRRGSPSTSANVYDSLGDGLMAAGDPAAAAARGEIAVRRAGR
ncbi:MAG TPA: hypothetical protein VK939_16560 [Longimicrobiales bacterium]|nr:hypothetical protein [Longimicrobiales bacterium]